VGHEWAPLGPALGNWTRTSKIKLFWSILAGLILTASFPPLKLDWMAWFALVPLLMAIKDESPSQAFRWGFVAGLVHYMSLVYWIIVALRSYGHLNLLVSLSVFLLLCLYLALYPAFFAYLFILMKGSRFLVFTAASLWVGLEYTRAKILTGFPWCLIGYTQFRHLNLIQVADLVGVYGLSFLIVLVNTLVFLILFGRTFPKRRTFKWEAVGTLFIALFTVVYGHQRLTKEALEGSGHQTIRAAIIQGNIDQSVKWNPAYQEKTLETYDRLTLKARDIKPDLVVWPETSVPFFFQDNVKFSPRIAGIAKESDADLIFGSPAYIQENHNIRYFNRAYAISPKGELYGYYDKIHLVPFGEYVPFKRFLPFVGRLVVAAGDFASGTKIEPLELPYADVGVLICFEAIFPNLARTQVKKGAKILVNLTNDAWFGKTSAPYQHLSMAVFRAVENRRPLIRAANTGISAFIGPQGKIITQDGLFTKEVLRGEVDIGRSWVGVYTHYGDVLALALLIIGVVKVVHVLCYNRFFLSR
jgi:apolipoprotein N-acyltransferase